MASSVNTTEMIQPQQTKGVHIKVPVPLHLALRAHAKQRQLSLDDFVNQIIYEWVQAAQKDGDIS